MSDTYNPPKKIYCAYHPKQLLTNFCAHLDCLMPLCPTCITDHTQEHYQQSTHPAYLNIDQAINNAKQQCISSISYLQNIERQIKHVQSFKSNLKRDLHSQLSKAKDFFYQQIAKMIDRYEQEIYSIILRDYTVSGLYEEQKIFQYHDRIVKSIGQLYQKVGILKGDQCLSGLIKYSGEDQPKVKALKSQIRQVTSEFKASKLQMTIEEAKFRQHMSNILDEVLSVKTYTFDNMPSKSVSQSYPSRQQVRQKYLTPEKQSRNSSKQRRKKIFDESRINPYVTRRAENISSIYMRSEPRNSLKRKYEYESLV